MSDEKTMGQVIYIDEARIRDHLGEMVRGTVEETLNAMLDAEADQLCGAGAIRLRLIVDAEVSDICKKGDRARWVVKSQALGWERRRRDFSVVVLCRLGRVK